MRTSEKTSGVELRVSSAARPAWMPRLLVSPGRVIDSRVLHPFSLPARRINAAAMYRRAV